MKKLVLASALLFAGSATAQTPQKTYTLTVNERDLAIISTALVERPYREVADVFGRLSAQVREQQEPKADKPAE